MSAIQASLPVVKEGAAAHGNLEDLLPPGYKRLIAQWLEEDAPSFDYGGFIVGSDPAEARLLGKSSVMIIFQAQVCKLLQPVGNHCRSPVLQ
jgi:hypothetical protein